MSRKFEEFHTVASLLDTEFLTGLVLTAIPTQQNVKISKANLLAGLATDASVSAVQANLDTHTAAGAGTAHPDGVTLTQLNAHIAGADQHPISGVTGLQAALDAKANTADLGGAAALDVGTIAGTVAEGDQPGVKVAAHESSFDHANLPTAAQKGALNANPLLSPSDPVASQSQIPPPGPTLHSELPDRNSSGHPGTVISIPGGVQGNAVAIAADETLVDAGIPPGGGGGGGTQKGTPFVVDDLVAVQSAAGDGIIKSVGFDAAAVWRNGVTVTDCGETGQLVAATGNETFDLDNGHFFYNSTPMTGDKTINFQSTADHDYTPWTALLDIGGRTVNWEFNSTPVRLADGYNISAGGLHLFYFVRSESTVVVSERGILP